MYQSILNSFPVIRTATAKNRHFHVPQPTFLFLLETPLRLSCNMLHGWKDNSMFVKPLAACTHLFSTVSQLFEPQEQKIAVFTYRSPHFCFSWRRSCDYHVICCMDGNTIQCLSNPCSMYPSIFNSFSVIRTASPKNRRFHLPQPTFLFPLETPLRLSRNMLHGWKENSMLVKPSQHVPIYIQ